jgi:HrpA-like RNA helicase
LFKAPERNIERAVQNLYNLDLIGPRGDITRLGEAVAELPTEVRTGKALALASKYSEKLGLPPEALVIPTIDMVACIEAKGIVTWESVSAASHGEASDYNKSRGRWKKLLNRTHNSDPVAQMEIFRSIMRLRPEHFKDWGIHLNHFHAAMSIRERICEALDIDPSTAPSRTLSAEQLRKIKEFHWAGSIDRLYRFVRRDAEDSNKREFKPVVSEGRLRFLSRDSVVTGSKFIVAEPLTIDTKYGDDDPMRLLVMASAVDPKWLDKNTPPQLKKSIPPAGG